MAWWSNGVIAWDMGFSGHQEPPSDEYGSLWILVWDYEWMGIETMDNKWIPSPVHIKHLINAQIAKGYCKNFYSSKFLDG